LPFIAVDFVEDRMEEEILLTEYDRIRYNRQMLLKDWGDGGQQRVKSSSVFIAGAGGLGSPVSMYLAAAGVGTISICDNDRVELSNLNRQILHQDARIGELKVESAKTTLQSLNPSIYVVANSQAIAEDSVESIVGLPDIIIDCLDNFETRYVLNAYSCKHNIPLIHGALWGMSGQVTFLHSPETACLQCIFPKSAPTEIFPVIGVTAGVIGCIQAFEALKYLTGTPSALLGKLMVFEGLEMNMSQFRVERRPNCPICGSLTSASLTFKG
jgi:adenylyltransferase/sulfurtransferase